MIKNYLMGSGILYNPKKKQAKDLNYQAMAKDKNQIKELRGLINEELKDCNHIHWPHVCEMQNTPKSLEKLQDMIIRIVAADGMGIGSAIALVEQELAHIPDGTGV